MFSIYWLQFGYSRDVALPRLMSGASKQIENLNRNLCKRGKKDIISKMRNYFAVLTLDAAVPRFYTVENFLAGWGKLIDSRINTL